MSELPQKIKLLLKTKIFRVFVIGAILYIIGFLIFMLTIYPDLTKAPGQNIFRNIIWIIYWRWNLDYIIFGVLAESLLIWGLRPNIIRLINGNERLVGFRAKQNRTSSGSTINNS